MPEVTNSISKFHAGERGFAQVSFALMLPLLLVLLSLYVWRWTQLDHETEARALCRRELSATLEKVSPRLTQLLEMNQTIRALKATRKAALIAMASPIPAIQAAAQATYQYVTAQLRVARVAQQTLIRTAEFGLARGLLRARSEIGQIAKNSGPSRVDTGRFEAVNPPRLQVHVRTGTEADPEYELNPDFARRQRLELKWQTRARLAAEGTNRWTKIQKSEFPESCGMTLVPRLRNQFAVRPDQDKFFWKR